MRSLAARTCSSKRSRVMIRAELQGASALGPVRSGQAPIELLFEERDLGARELVQRLEVVVGRDARVRDDQDPMLDVVERQHRVEQHEPGVVCAVGALAEVAEHRFEPRGRAVPEVADRAAGEPRQVGHERRPEVRHQAAQRVDERLLADRRDAAAIDRRSAVARAKNEERILAEERIAADVLAAFDALQQERVVGVLGNLQERRDRRQQVGDDLLADGHERAAPGQVLELVKRGDFHRAQTPPAASARLPASHRQGPWSRSTTETARAPARPACRGRRWSGSPFRAASRSSRVVVGL